MKLSSFGSWIRGHKFLAVLLVIGAFLLWEILTIPYFSIYSLKTTNPQETALMRQRMDEAEEAGKKLRISNRWISISRIPRQTLDAVIAAEDGTFYTHGGIDWFEVQESISKNIEEGRAARGASTITQQLAKNLYLSTSKSILRKLEEVVITLLMETHLTKTRILELYVNLIEWGPGVFGIDAAARTYFGKSASELTLDESLRLAAVIPSPLRHRPNGDSRYVSRRSRIVLNRMIGRGQTEEEDLVEEEIEEEEIDTTLQEPDSMVPMPLRTVEIDSTLEFPGDTAKADPGDTIE